LRKALLDSALRFYKEFTLQRTTDPELLADLAIAHMRVGLIDHTVGKNDDALEAIEQALNVIDRLRREFPDQLEPRGRLAGFWKGYRPTLTRTAMPRNPQAALQVLERAGKTWQELADEHPQQPAFRSDLASLCYLTGVMLGGINEGESLRYLERSKALLEKLALDEPQVPEHRADLARVCQELVRKLFAVERRPEARAIQDQALSLQEELVAQHPKTPQYRLELARILYLRANYIASKHPSQAETMYRRAADLSYALVREFPDSAIYWEVLAANMGDWGENVLSRGKQEQKEYFEQRVQDVEAWAADGPRSANAKRAARPRPELPGDRANADWPGTIEHHSQGHLRMSQRRGQRAEHARESAHVFRLSNLDCPFGWPHGWVCRAAGARRRIPRGRGNLGTAHRGNRETGAPEPIRFRIAGSRRAMA
jgi:tetratricopeptide (TPR) repeat protein